MVTSAEMESRLPDLSSAYRTPRARVEVDDFTPIASFGVMAMYREQVRPGGARDRVERDHPGTASALAVAAVALVSPPVLITLGIAAGVFSAIGSWRRRRIDTIAAAKQAYAEVEKSILNKALPFALKQAEVARDAVIEGIQLLSKEHQEQIARDRSDLDEVANLDPEERTGRKHAVELDQEWAAHIASQLDEVEKG